MNYLEFWNKFLAAEKKAEVYEIKTIGFQLYPMLRVRLYYQIAQELKIFDNPHPNAAEKTPAVTHESIRERIRPAKTVVVPFARKVQGIDVYTESILEHLGEAATILDVVSPDAGLDIEAIKAYGKTKFDNDVYQKMLTEKVRDVRDRWAKMSQVFTAEFGIGLGKFEEFPAWLVRRYIAECMAFKEYFELSGTKQLYIVNAYSHPAVVVGAKQAGVRVSEIQHGFISEYHPAYSYPKIRIQSAPDQILVWGKYWLKACDYPKGMKPKVLGPSKQFKHQRNLVQSQEAMPNSVLFTSQGAVGGQLMEWAISWAKLAPDYAFTFRLHPNESLADYQRFETPPNLQLSHREPNFLEVLGRHEYLVGGFSTTLYEGVSFSRRVIVLPISGFENLQRAIAAGDMTLAKRIENESELKELLATSTISNNPYAYYAKDISLKGLVRA